MNMSTKKTASMSLDDSVHEALDKITNNKSAFVNRLLTQLLIANRNTLKVIEIQLGKVDYNEIIELGLQAQADKAEKQRLAKMRVELLKPKPKPVSIIPTVLNVLERGIANWADLVATLAELDIDIVLPAKPNYNVPSMYCEDSWLSHITNGKYRLGIRGAITKV